MTKPIFRASRLSLVSFAILSVGLIPCATFAQEDQPNGTSFVDNFDRIDSKPVVYLGWLEQRPAPELHLVEEAGQC